MEIKELSWDLLSFPLVSIALLAERKGEREISFTCPKRREKGPGGGGWRGVWVRDRERSRFPFLILLVKADCEFVMLDITFS